MEEISKLHTYLLSERTYIRNHKAILMWMRKCWKIAPHASALRMTIAEYNELYSTLLCEMTICWEDELGDAILEKMRRRDMSSFADLNFDRFCCSLFFFVEMWVQAVTTDEYERIFRHIRSILSGDAPTVSLTNPTTLASFNTALNSILDLEQSSLNIGKSISFDTRRYYLQFGAAGIPQLTQQVSDAPIRQRVINSVVAPTPRTPCSMKRYQDGKHGVRLYKLTTGTSTTSDEFADLQSRPMSSFSPLQCDRSSLHTWHANRQRHAHITSASELECSLLTTTHRITALGEFSLKSYVQHRPARPTRSAKYRLHTDAFDNN